MKTQLRPAICLLFLLTLLTGVVYPLAVTLVGKIIFPKPAEGGIIYHDGKPIGSELIGQPFTESRYFWTRPSATAPVAYNASAGSGSNFAPSNPQLADAVRQRVAALKIADPSNDAPIPVDLVTASASGLDPHISVAAARYQTPRVARVRGLPVESVEKLVARCTESRTFGVLGESRVNVLRLNLALDGRE